jgi:uncharacterized protein YfaS (alpha-2-macroglobulin family)
MAAPGDEFTVSVGVFNNSAGSGPIRLEAQGSAGVTPVGSSAVDLQIQPKKEAAGEFRFKANAVLGSADLKFIARRGTAEARIEESVSVRPAVPYRTQLTLGRFDGSGVPVALARDMYPERRKVEAAVSSVPLVWGRSLIAWLDDYPYLCTEQLVSKGVAALLLSSRPEFGAVKTRNGAPPPNPFATLESRQNDSGGFGLWASSADTAEFPTVYAAQFLLEAKDRGQKVPPALLASVDAGAESGGCQMARVRCLPSGAAGNPAGERALQCRAGTLASLRAGMAHGSGRGLAGGDVPANAAERGC